MREPGLHRASFVAARDVVPAAKVVPKSALRVVLPVAVSPERSKAVRAQLGEGRAPWKLCKPSGTMVAYATDISETWECAPAQLLKGRGDMIDVSLSPGKQKDAWTVFAVLSDLRFTLYRDSGIAFLVVTLTVDEPQPLVDWLDLAAVIRFTDRRRGATIRRSAEQGALVPETIRDIMIAMADSLSLSAELVGKPLFLKKQMLISGTWFVEGVDEEGEELVRYAARSQFSSRFLIGAGEEERTGRAGNRLPYALRQDFVSTLECTHYLGFDVPREHPFFGETLPEHLDNDYFSAWLFALQQRYFLLGEIAKLADEALKDAARSAADRYDEIDTRAEALARFEARGYELQLYQIEHHHRYWAACRDTLDIDGLHSYLTGLLERAVARTEAKRIEEQTQREAAQLEEQLARDRDLAVAESHRAALTAARAKSLERRIIAALALPGIAFGFAGINIEGWTAGKDGASQLFALIVLGVNLVIVACIVFLRPRVSKQAQTSAPLPQVPTTSREEATEHG